MPRALSAGLGLAATVVVAALSGGCGYRMAGQGSVLPGHVRKFIVVPFENRTQRPEIDQFITQAVSQELAQRGRYEVVTDRGQADAMLEGVILTYRTATVQFDEELLANRVEAIVRLQATVRDLSTDDVLWSQDGFVFKGQFDVPVDELFSNREVLALEQIALEAAGALVTSILEGF